MESQKGRGRIITGGVRERKRNNIYRSEWHNAYKEGKKEKGGEKC